MTPEQLQEAIKRLNDMGYQVVSDKRAMIPEKQKTEIQEEINQFEVFCNKRLDALGLTFDQLDQETLRLKKNGERRGYEVENLRNAFFIIEALRDDLRQGWAPELFRDAVFLGEVLLSGDGRNPWDIGDDQEEVIKDQEEAIEEQKKIIEDYQKFKNNFHETRIESALKNKKHRLFEDKMKPMAFDEAFRLWKENNDLMLKDVAKLVDQKLKDEFRHLKVEYPEISTIRTWLKEADSDETNPFTMPPHATRPGRRPAKK